MIGRRRRAVLVGLAVVVLVIAAAALYVRLNRPVDLARTAQASASSTLPGTSVDDLLTSQSTSAPGAGWAAAQPAVGAWVQFDWTSSHRIGAITVVRPASTSAGVSAGYLTFSDGSRLMMPLTKNSPSTRLSFIPRDVSSVRLTITALGAGTTRLELDEVIISSADGQDAAGLAVDGASDGDVALGAQVTSSAGDPQNSRRLQDGDPASGALGASWLASNPVGSWAEYHWDTPREIASIELIGNGSGAGVGSATLTFSDGTSLPVAGVSKRPELPTIVGFLPRVVTSVRLRIDTVVGQGALGLSEWQVYQRGATPSRFTPTTGRTSTNVEPTASCAGTKASREPITVLCPLLGSAVGDRARLRLRVGAGYQTVSAKVLATEANQQDGAMTQVNVADGAAELTLNTSGLPAGPFTVDIVADRSTGAAATVHLTLDHQGTQPAATRGSAGTGRTLVYHEAFDQPVSIAADGVDATYTAGKPNTTGTESFGEADFADPATDPDVYRSVDQGSLRILARPDSASSAGSVGGLLSSARPGGSGFSAQYGYFEARMLTSAAPGTWPAFWMLPANNLVQIQPTVAEVDTVELYGHDPASACQATHSYADGKDQNGRVQCGTRFASVAQALQWHTYGVEVSPAEIVFSIDNVVVARAAQVPGGGVPLFFMIDLALGGGWPVDLGAVQGRAALFVDDIRVYE